VNNVTADGRREHRGQRDGAGLGSRASVVHLQRQPTDDDNGGGEGGGGLSGGYMNCRKATRAASNTTAHRLPSTQPGGGVCVCVWGGGDPWER
jgi:hypothetical protein